MAFRTSLLTFAVLAVSTLTSNAAPLTNAALRSELTDRGVASVVFEQSENSEGTLVYRSDTPLMTLTRHGYRLRWLEDRSLVAA